MPKPATIAIDGPVACGKSTIGRLLAQRLGYRFVDTGAMYRAITWEAINRSIDLEDEESLQRLAEATAIEFSSAPGGEGRVTADGRDVTPRLHSAEVEGSVSLVSKVAAVREVLVREQQALAQGGGIVMAGRDIGTTVLPDADLKVFLEASFEERARRRHLELMKGGKEADYDDILADLMRRDEIDSKRAVSPLQPAADAAIIDTDGLDIEGVISRIMGLMEGR